MIITRIIISKPSKMRLVLLSFFCLSIISSNPCQSDKEVLNKIILEADSSSTIRNSLIHLSDVYGPRLMGTPQYHNAVLWAQKELNKWGINNVKLQSFDDNHVGWSIEEFSIQLTEPNFAPLNAYPLAFSKSTDGELEGESVLINTFQEVYVNHLV